MTYLHQFLNNTTHRLVSCEWRVPCHKEVETRCGDQRCNQANEVIVHVAGVSQGGGAGRHDGGNLCEQVIR